MHRLSVCLIIGSALIAGCTAPAQPNGQTMATIALTPDLTNQFLLSRLDDNQIDDPILGQIVRAMRRDDFFRLTLERASCGAPGAQYWAGFDNQFNIALEGDPVTAFMWYSLAAKQGHGTAERALSELSNRMTANEIATAKDRAKHWRPADC